MPDSFRLRVLKKLTSVIEEITPATATSTISPIRFSEAV